MTGSLNYMRTECVAIWVKTNGDKAVRKTTCNMYYQLSTEDRERTLYQAWRDTFSSFPLFDRRTSFAYHKECRPSQSRFRLLWLHSARYRWNYPGHHFSKTGSFWVFDRYSAKSNCLPGKEKKNSFWSNSYINLWIVVRWCHTQPECGLWMFIKCECITKNNNSGDHRHARACALSPELDRSSPNRRILFYSFSCTLEESGSFRRPLSQPEIRPRPSSGKTKQRNCVIDEF